MCFTLTLSSHSVSVPTVSTRQCPRQWLWQKSPHCSSWHWDTHGPALVSLPTAQDVPLFQLHLHSNICQTQAPLWPEHLLLIMHQHNLYLLLRVSLNSTNPQETLRSTFYDVKPKLSCITSINVHGSKRLDYGYQSFLRVNRYSYCVLFCFVFKYQMKMAGLYSKGK